MRNKLATKILSIFLIGAMVLGLAPVSTFAENISSIELVDEITASEEEIVVDAAALDGYTAIHNREELEQVGQSYDDVKKYYLANDIDLSGQDWTPLTFYASELIIDGQDHAIKNMTVNSDTNAGFFYSTPGSLTISDLSFENVNLNGENAGAICGYMSPGGWLNQKLIFSNISVSGSISASSKAGGLLGYLGNIYDEEGYIKFIECTNNAAIVTTSTYGGDSAGGLVGVVGGGSDSGKGELTFESCINNGNVTARDVAAGICGELKIVNTSINECENKGNITATHYAGGIVARNQRDNTNNYTINKCTNSGKIKSKEYSGGIIAYSESNLLLTECNNVGGVESTDDDYTYGHLGGILAYHTRYALSITNCNNYADVLSKGYAGGVLCGANGAKSVNIDSCKNSGNIISCEYKISGGIVGMIRSDDMLNDYGTDFDTYNYRIGGCENNGDAYAGILASAFMFYEECPDLKYSLLIENCKNTGVINGYAGIATSIGGQENTKCIINNCINYGDINGQGNAAGIYNNDGYSFRGTFEITDCENAGAVTVWDGNAAGIAVGKEDVNFVIKNCINKGKITVKSSEKYNRYMAAGIAASLYGETEVVDCTNHGEISSYGYAAGIAGYAQNIDRCCNYGNVNSLSYASGIAHEISYEEGARVSQSINYGKVYVLADGYYAANGIVGYGKAVDCINAGNVRCIQSQDGEAEGHVDVRAAGISCSAEVTNSYNLGQVVSGPGYSNKVLAAGIGNYQYSGAINGCINLSNLIEAKWINNPFADEDNYPRAQAIGLKVDEYRSGNNFYRSDGTPDEKYSIATGKDKEVFYSRAIYDEAGWDFDNVWEMPTNGGLPVLKWQNIDEGLYMKDVTGVDEDEDYEYDFGNPYQDDDELQIIGFINSAIEYTTSRSGDGLLVYTINTTSPNIFITPRVTRGASYKLYSDFECTDQFSTDYVSLDLGNNFFYAKIEKEVNYEHQEAICIIYIIREEPAIEGDEEIIVPFERTDIKINWGPSLFMNGSYFNPQVNPSVRNDKLAVVGLTLSSAVEKSLSRAESVASAFGFREFASDHFDEPFNVNNPAYLIGSEEIELDGRQRTLITVVIRGTSGAGDVITDAIAQVGEASEDNGFRKPARNIYSEVEDYIENYYPDNRDNFVFFVTGHSLGGACAVLTGQHIKQDFPNSDTFVYAFAPPKYTKISNSGGYIHQYINCNDAVPQIPYGDFPRVGNIYSFAGSTIALKEYWDGLLTEEKPLPNAVLSLGNIGHIAHFFVDNNEYSNHSNNIYMAYLLHNVRSRTTLANVSGGRRLIFTVECPVDVTIKDAKGNVLASVINNVIDGSVADGVYATVDGDKKYFLCTINDDLKVELNGTDDGTMKYSISELNYDSRPSKNKIYENVKLSKDKEFVFGINKGDSLENTKLFVVDPDTKKAMYEVECDGNEIEANETEVNEVVPNGFIVRVLDDLGNEIKDGHYSTLYTGGKITPSVNVYHNGVKLTENHDYKLSYGNNTAAADIQSEKAPFIKVTGIDQYSGAKSVKFDIKKVSFKDCEFDDSVVVNKGSKFSPVIIYNGVELNKKYYTLSKIDNWTDDGVLTVTAKSTGDFEGSISINVKTTDAPQKAFKALFSSEKLTYNGTSQIPKIKVVDSNDSNLTLTEGVHYKVSVSNDTKTAGKHSIIIRGIGEYTGKIAKAYAISPLKLTSDAMSYEMEQTVPFNILGARAAVKSISARVNGEMIPLVLNKDYKVQYSNNKKASNNQAVYQISFINNYKGSAPIKGTYSIEKANGADFRIVTSDKVGYTKPGKYAVKPLVEYNSKIVAASDYTVKYYIDSAMTKEMDSNENALTIPSGQDYATVYVKVTGKNNFSDASVVGEYKVYKQLDKDDLRLNLSGMRIDIAPASSAFSGVKCEPKVTVTYKMGTETKTLDASKYSVKYVNNLYKGTATVVVTGNGVDVLGAGAYVLGTKTKTFSIKPGNVAELGR